MSSGAARTNRSRARALVKRLKAKLVACRERATPRMIARVIPSIAEFNDLINVSAGADEHSGILASSIFADDTAEIMIGILPHLGVEGVNAVSTLLQSTIRKFPEVLPLYLAARSELLERFLAMLHMPDTANGCNAVFRACLASERFTRELFRRDYELIFVRYLTGAEFNRLTAAFGAYEALLVTHPQMTFENLAMKWGVFGAQLKMLASSPIYIVRLNFLPVLIRVLTLPVLRPLLTRFLDDVENVQWVMGGLLDRSRRIRNHAWALFKMFVAGQRQIQNPLVTGVLAANAARLRDHIRRMVIDGQGTPEVENERRGVIERITAMIPRGG